MPPRLPRGWIARLGFLASRCPARWLIGYMAGIAVLMIISQLGKITGIDAEGDSAFEELRSVATQLDQIHLPTLALGVGILLLLLPFTAGSSSSWAPLIAMLLRCGARWLSATPGGATRPVAAP